MSRPRDFRDLLERRDRMERDHPDLRRDFDRYVEDLKAFEGVKKSLSEKSSPEDYLLYGASYRGER